MALLHKATLSPSKLDALAAWLPTRPWAGAVGELTQVASYRFDDPAGEVGIEALLVRTGDGRLLQVPLTYRSTPMPAGDDALVASMEHSVLGPRWTYDGCADPVAVRALATAILTGGRQADLEYDAGDGAIQRREPTARVTGSRTPGTPVLPLGPLTVTSTATDTTVDAGSLVLTVRRRLDTPATPASPLALHGTWADTPDPVLLATLDRH